MLTKLELAERAAALTVETDMAVFLGMMRGVPVPAGTDVTELLKRVAFWQKRRLTNHMQSSPEYRWEWALRLLISIHAVYGLRYSRAVLLGEWLNVASVTCSFIWALVAWIALVAREAIRPYFVFGLSPLKHIVEFTAV